MTGVLPSFLMIGAARSGTTSIYHSLCEHPDIFMPIKKEPQFFTSNWEKGIDWYKKQFAHYAGQKIIGEASVTYTYPDYPHTPARIAELIPNAKLLYVLRHPVERTYSHYIYYFYYRGDETRNFWDALHEHPIYLGTSLYYDWIKRYLAYFNPSKLLIMLFEDYITNPAKFIRNIFRFLEVDEAFLPHSLSVKTNEAFKPHNAWLFGVYRRISLSKTRMFLESLLPQSLRPHARNTLRSILGTSKQIPIMPPDVRAYLGDFFEPEISRLENYLGRNLDIWKVK